MRFGKRLAEVTQNGRASAPYISYKELKHIIGELERLIGSSSAKDGDSSDDGANIKASAMASNPTNSATSSCAASDSSSSARHVQAEAKQQEFFRRIDTDVDRARSHIQNSLASLETAVGEWQFSAVLAGFLFTPEQLDELAAQLPFPVEDRKVLLNWVIGLPSPPQSQDAKLSLVEKYSGIAVNLNVLLQYIEVNLMAIRKILKKFERKVPADLRLQHAREYRIHHGLFMTSVQQLLVTVVHMQRLVFGLLSSDQSEAIIEAVASAVPVSQVGPESLAVLSCLQGAAGLDEILASSAKTAKIDVYAKPMAPDQCGPAGTASVASALVGAAIAQLPTCAGVQMSSASAPAVAYPEVGRAGVAMMPAGGLAPPCQQGQQQQPGGKRRSHVTFSDSVPGNGSQQRQGFTEGCGSRGGRRRGGQRGGGRGRANQGGQGASHQQHQFAHGDQQHAQQGGLRMVHVDGRNQ